MIQHSTRRCSLFVIFCLAVAGIAVPGRSQSSTAPKGAASANGVTGTDPCPKNYICATGVPVPSTAATGGSNSATTTPSTSNSVLQGLLAILGGKSL